MTWNGIPILVQRQFPPIPTRNFDYCATLGEPDEGVKHAYGPSADIARAELIQELYDSGEF